MFRESEPLRGELNSRYFGEERPRLLQQEFSLEKAYKRIERYGVMYSEEGDQVKKIDYKLWENLRTLFAYVSFADSECSRGRIIHTRLLFYFHRHAALIRESLIRLNRYGYKFGKDKFDVIDKIEHMAFQGGSVIRNELPPVYKSLKELVSQLSDTYKPPMARVWLAKVKDRGNKESTEQQLRAIFLQGVSENLPWVPPEDTTFAALDEAILYYTEILSNSPNPTNASLADSSNHVEPIVKLMDALNNDSLDLLRWLLRSAMYLKAELESGEQNTIENVLRHLLDLVDTRNNIRRLIIIDRISRPGWN